MTYDKESNQKNITAIDIVFSNLVKVTKLLLAWMDRDRKSSVITLTRKGCTKTYLKEIEYDPRDFKAALLALEQYLEWQNKLDTLVETINTYLDLPNDWDGYDGVAPTSKTIQDCILLVERSPESIVIPKPMLGGSGTVGLYWEKDDIYAEVCFEGDGTFWYYGTDGNNEIGVDSIKILPDTQFPEDLKHLLKNI